MCLLACMHTQETMLCRGKRSTQNVMHTLVFHVLLNSTQDPAYWGSWTITHFSNMAVSGVLCAVIGTYPFSHSSAAVLLSFYWLVALALISYAYFLSTMFSKSRIAGTAASAIYAVSMVPGCVPSGALSWPMSCIPLSDKI